MCDSASEHGCKQRMHTIHKTALPPHTHTNTHTNMLICTHLTWIETTGWQFSSLTGSIRGQSAAEPHAVQPQRDTLDYRETTRHTIVEGQRVVQGLGGDKRSRMMETAGGGERQRMGMRGKKEQNLIY